MRRITCIALDPADLHVLPIDDLSIYNVVQESGIETMITVLSVFSAFRTGFFADGCILCYVLAMTSNAFSFISRLSSQKTGTPKKKYIDKTDGFNTILCYGISFF
jgi:hypothetical protein